MPLSRYKLRNEYTLADPELYRAVDKDHSEALLEALAMAGLIGVLRQLGDIAEFAAEIFNDLHEEVTATAARGHTLTVRVQQLEEELPLIEKKLLSHTNQSSFFYNAGTNWHPNLPLNHNMVTRGDLPRHVMDSYEECRGPPRLFLLDKFDVAGAGSCLKRYTDPSIFKVEASDFKFTNRDVQRETKPRKSKKKGSRCRKGKIPEVLPTSNAKLHQLLLEERIETESNNSGHRATLKRRLNGFPFDSRTVKSYMEKLLETPSVDQKIVREVFVDSLSLKMPISIASETGLSVHKKVAVSINGDNVTWRTRNSSPSQREQRGTPISCNDSSNEIVAYDESQEVSNQSHSSGAGGTLSTLHNVSTDGELSVDGDRQDTTSGHQSDHILSDLDDYMDAPTSMESELDSESDLGTHKDLQSWKVNKTLTTNNEQIQTESSGSQSIHNSILSDDENGSKKEISSFLNSGSCSTSPEMDHMEGEGVPKDFSMTEIQVQTCDSSFDSQSSDDEALSVQPLENAVYNGTCTKTAGINRTSSDFGQPMTDSSVLDSVFIPGYADEEVIMKTEFFEGPLTNEIISTLDENEKNYACVVENAANPSAPRILNAQERMGDDSPSRVSDENQLQIQGAIINNHTTSAANVNNVPSIGSDETPIPLSTGNERKYSLDVGHLNQSNNLSIASSIFSLLSQNRDEKCSARSLHLHGLNDKGTNFFENSNSFHNPSNPSSSGKDHFPSSSAVNYSSDAKAQNISPDTSHHIQNVLEVSLEKHVKCSFQVEPKEEGAERNHRGASCLDDTPVDSNLFVTPKDIKNFGLVSEIESDDAGLDYDERLTDAIPIASQRDFDVLVVDYPTNLDYVETDISGVRDGFLPLDFGERRISCSGKESVDDVFCPRIDEKVDHITFGYPEADETVTEADQLLNVGSAAGLVDSTEEVVKIHASSCMDIKKFQDDSISSSGQLTPKQFHSKSLCLLDGNKESVKVKVGHDGLTSTVYDSSSHEIAGYDPPECEVHASDLDNAASVDTEQSSVDMEPLSSSGDNLNDVIRDRTMYENPDKVNSDDACIGETVESAEIQLDEGLVGNREAKNELSPLPERAHILRGTVATPLGFEVLPGNNQIIPEEMPPLPPVQWRLKKVQHTSPAVERNLAECDAPKIDQPLDQIFSSPVIASESSSGFCDSVAHSMEHSGPLSSHSSRVLDENDEDSFSFPVTADSSNPFISLPESDKLQTSLFHERGTPDHLYPFPQVTPVDKACIFDFETSQEELIHPSEQTAKETISKVQELEGETPSEGNLATDDITRLQARYEDSGSTGGPVSSEIEVIQALNQVSPETSFNEVMLEKQDTSLEANCFRTDTIQSAPTVKNEKPSHDMVEAIEKPTVGDGKVNGSQKVKLPQAPSPPIETVDAFNKSRLRKVTDQDRHRVKKVDERDSLLELIRTKSFNLKPTVATRPNIQGPQTNLKVVAILERAQTIRQAFAGSDEDDNEDSWSDS